MSNTTAATPVALDVLDVLSVVTGAAKGLFVEDPTRTKVRATFTQRFFVCDAESDEYVVLLNKEGKVLEIKNAYTSWGQDIIKDLMNPAPRQDPAVLAAQQQAALQNNGPANALGQLGQMASQMMAGATQFTPQPTLVLPALNASNTPAHVTDIAQIQQFIADTIIANPNCIQNLFTGKGITVNEAAAQLATAWEFMEISGALEDNGGQNGTTTEFHMQLQFFPKQCSDQNIADQTMCYVTYDFKNNAIIEVVFWEY